MQVIAKQMQGFLHLVDHMTRRHEGTTNCVVDPYRRTKKLGTKLVVQPKVWNG